MNNLVIPDTLHRESLVFDLLDNSNYASWRKNMRILFMRMSLLDLIDHVRPPDATPAWETANKWAFSEIYFRCRPDIQSSLSDTMTARQAWTSLEDVFQSSSTANIFQLTLAFNTLDQRVGQPVLTFINDVVAAATDLRYLGEDVSDQKIKWQILANLLPEYASLVTTLTNLDRDDDPLDVRDIKESCMREERIMNRRAAVLLLQQPPAPITAPPAPPAPAPVAYAASSSNRGTASASSSGTRRCEECGLSGHTVQTCWVRYPELQPSMYRSRDDRTYRHRSRERDRHEPRGRERRDRGNSRERHDQRGGNSRERRGNSRERRGNSHERRDRRDRDRQRRDQSRGRGSPTASRHRERRRTRSTDKYRTSDKENRVSKRKVKPPSKYNSSSSDSSSSEDTPNTHHAKAAQGIPVGKNVPNVINHACMVGSSVLSDSRLLSSDSRLGSRWLLDSGASNHYTSDVHLLTDVRSIPPTPVETANKVIYATAKGTLVLHLTCGTISITDVMYVPDLLPNTHLISIGQLESKGLEFHMRNRKCYMFKLGALWAVAPRENFVYYLQECSPEQLAMHMNSFPPIIPPLPFSAKIILSSYNAKRRTDTQLLTTWHRRLGHINKKYLSRVP